MRRFAASPGALGVAAIFAASFVAARFVRAPCDDAYIFYVYVRNLLDGNGLTFNGAVVEGTTSLLWPLLLAVPAGLGVPLPIAGEGLSAASGAFALAATYRLARTVGLSEWAALMPVALLASGGDFVFYLSTGMETLLFTGLVAWCSADAVEGHRGNAPALRPRFALALAAMILTRPEGLLIAALAVGFASLRGAPGSGLARTVALAAALVGPVWIAKALYYGYPLPNTFYAKSAGAGLANVAMGGAYVGAALLRTAPIGAFAVVGVLARGEPLGRDARESLIGLLAASAIWLGWVCVRGGDNMVGARELLPALPWLCVAAVRAGCPASPRAAVALSAAVCLALAAGWAVSDAPRHADTWRHQAQMRTWVGRHLRDTAPPDTVVATNAAGMIPFYSQLPTIDMLGLNDVEIAHTGRRDRRLPFGHQAGDGFSVLRREPDVILFGAGASATPSATISDRQIARAPRFSRDYVRVDWPPWGSAWVRPALQQTLATAPPDAVRVAPAGPDPRRPGSARTDAP